MISPDKKDNKTSRRFLWEDHSRTKRMLSQLNVSNPSKYCYTLIEKGIEQYIISGWQNVDSIGHFISTEKIRQDLELKYC